MTFKVDYTGSTVPVKTKGVLGVQHIYPALAAFAVGATQGLNLVSMSQSLSEEHEAQPGRMKLIEGIKGSTIIDDSYNSSPVAVRWALRTLGDVQTNGRKIAVLGDMMELGEYSPGEHKKLGELAFNTCQMLVTVGLRSRDTAAGALNAGMDESNILQFEDSRKAGAYLQNIIEKNDVILVKGSRWAMRMERTVEEIMAHPERAGELLVQ